MCYLTLLSSTKCTLLRGDSNKTPLLFNKAIFILNVMIGHYARHCGHLVVAFYHVTSLVLAMTWRTCCGI